MGKYAKTFEIATKRQKFFSWKPKIKRYEIIDSVSKLKKLARKMATLEEFSFDTETNTLAVNGPNSKFTCVSIQICWGEYDNYYIPLHHKREEDYYRNIPERKLRQYLRPVFENPDIRLVGQNIKFDIHVLTRLNIHVKTTDIFDTMIMSWLCDENTPNGLKENSAMKLGIDQTHFVEAIDTVPKEVKKEFGLKATQKATFDLVLIDDAAKYGLGDSFYTWELYLGFLDLLEHEKMTKIYERHYKPFLLCLFKMEERGVCVDTYYLDEMDKKIDEEIEDLTYRMIELAGVEFNPKSSQHLYELFFGYEKEPPKDKNGNRKKLKNGQYAEAKVNWDILNASFNFKVIGATKNGAPATDNDVFFRLSKMQFKNKRKQEGVELATLMLEYKKIIKLRDAFVKGIREQIYDDGKVHCHFNIIGADSGRLSCSEPNLQQLPKSGEEDNYKIRKLFIGDVDEETGKRKKIIACDYSNLEMRVLTHFSEDEHLLKMFANNEDSHGSTAVLMFNLDCQPGEVKKKYPHLRQAAKVLNFLLMYGGGAMRLYESLKGDHYSPIDLGAPEYLKEYHAKDGIEVAQIYIDKYFEGYKGITRFMREQKRFAKKNGYVQTLLRRKRRLPDILSHDFKLASYQERLAINATIQGSAADITSSAQIRIDNEPWFIEHRCLMLLQVHDELVFECPEEYVEEAIEKIKAYMLHPFGDKVELNVRLDSEADSGDSYQDAK